MTEIEELQMKAMEDNINHLSSENNIIRNQIDQKHKDNVALWDLIKKLTETNNNLSNKLCDQ